MKNRTLRIVLNILIVLSALGFLAGLLYFVNGSLEMFPTAEQEETARIVAIVIMVSNALLCAVCIIARTKTRKGTSNDAD
ncbi:MAG: hypothetical protein IKZ87_03415 [Actinomycetaceae bacterium]|nr:hypothetical protein [Actinomycetaceae bacterium]